MSKTLTFCNPILPGFYPDPSAIRVGDDYYLVTSTFEYFPGVPIFHSKDLVNWTQLGHVLTRESQVNLLERKSSQGIYAPVLRYYDGLFYMITTDVYGINNFYVTASNPAGPWSDPITIPYGNIDPSLFFDDDGKVYVTVQAGFGEDSHIIQYEINPATGEALTEPVVVFEGDEGPWVEGPHLYKINGVYYMMTASGGTGPEHREIIGRSEHPYGPFELLEEPILTHKDLPDHPIQYTGHAELIDDPDGNWWALFLGVRIRNDRGSVLGRETFLAPVTWVDGWPMIDNNEGHVDLQMKVTVETAHEQEQLITQRQLPHHMTATFSAKQPLGHEWIYTRVNASSEAVSLTASDGYLTLIGNENSLSDGHNMVYVCRRQLHHAMRIEAALSYSPSSDGEEAGIAARLSEASYYAIGVTKRSDELAIVVSMKRYDVLEQKLIPLAKNEAQNDNNEQLWLSIESNDEMYSLYYSFDQVSWKEAGSGLARDITPTSDSSFTGVMLGMYAHGTKSRPSERACFSTFNYIAKQ